MSNVKPHTQVVSLTIRQMQSSSSWVYAPLIICATCGERIKYSKGSLGGIVSWPLSVDEKESSVMIFTHKGRCSDSTRGWNWVDIDVWLADLVYNTGLDAQLGASGGRDDGWFHDRFLPREDDPAPISDFDSE